MLGMFYNSALCIYETFERHRNKRLFCLLLLFIFWYTIKVYSLDYFFTATFKQHQVWYPNFYLLVFLSVKLLYGLFYSGWLLLIIPKIFFKNSAVLKVIVVALGVLVLLQFTNFYFVKSLFLLLLVIEIAVWNLPLVLKAFSLFKREKDTTTYGFLLAYLLLCLVMPDHFLPFYKFSMFNAMEPKAKVILFRNTKDEVVPLACFTKASAHELGVVYEIQKKKGKNEKESGIEILNHAMQLAVSGAITLPNQVCVRHFWVQGNKLFQKEILLYEVEF